MGVRSKIERARLSRGAHERGPAVRAASTRRFLADTVPARSSNVSDLAATFDADYNALPTGHPLAATAAPNLIWSPGAREAFLQEINVDVTSEELRDRPIVRALENAAHHGVVCGIVLTANAAWTNAVREVSAAGCAVHLLLASGQLYMHEKMILTDAATDAGT